VIKIFLGGEGANELGSRARDPIYRPNSAEYSEGVIEACLRKISDRGWDIVGAKCWKDLCRSKSVPKLRVNRPIDAEEHNVRVLALAAQESGANLLTFVRDSDGDFERADAIQKGLAAARADFSPQLSIVGACAIACLESWLLALRGKYNTETMSTSRAQSELGCEKNTECMVSIVESSDFTKIPTDAQSLRGWIGALQAHLNGASADPKSST
jgi:hypothetical protein